MSLDKILEYMCYTPENMNFAILENLLDEYGATTSQVNELFSYLSCNRMNPIIVRQILEKGSSGSNLVGSAVVGTATAG